MGLHTRLFKDNVDLANFVNKNNISKEQIQQITEAYTDELFERSYTIFYWDKEQNR